MSYFIITSIAVGLLLSYVVVLVVERSRGKRLFQVYRTRLDARVTRGVYIVNHIDWGAFFGHVLKVSLEKIAHDIVHGILLAVRTVERSLTKAIRLLRGRLAHRGDAVDAQEGFELTRTLRRFRKKPQIDTIEEN